MHYKGIIGILLFLVVLFLFARDSSKDSFLDRSTTSSNNPTPIIKVTPDPERDLSSVWSTYIDVTNYGTGKFSIEYPSTWEQNTEYGIKKVFYPLGKNEKDFIASLGQGGSGVPPSTCEKRTFPGGVADYCWFKDEKGIYRYAMFEDGNISYIFRLGFIPIEYERSYEDIFNRMLKTFKKLEN